MFAPKLDVQIKIISGLLKLKHFDGVWYNSGTLSVRRFRDHEEEPQYLSWEAAARMIGAAELLNPGKPEFHKSLAVRRLPEVA